MELAAMLRHCDTWVQKSQTCLMMVCAASEVTPSAVTRLVQPTTTGSTSRLTAPSGSPFCS